LGVAALQAERIRLIAKKRKGSVFIVRLVEWNYTSRSISVVE
jgi:hypothetical protein